jgi:hypothetical protein
VAVADRWARESDVPTVTTDAAGAFRFERLPPEPLHMRVRGGGYPQHVRRVDPTDPPPFEVVVTKGGRLDVEVVDPDGGPLRGVWLNVRLGEDLPYDADGDSTRRDIAVGADGRRALLVCAGPRRISAGAEDGRTSASVSVVVREGEATPVRLVLHPREED